MEDKKQLTPEQLKEIAIKKRQRKIGFREHRKKKKRELCAYCKKRRATTTEHFIPQSSALDIAFRKINLIPACRPCNMHKGGRWPSQKEIDWFFEYWKKELEEIEKHLKIAHAIKRNKHGHVPEEGNDKRRRPRNKRRHRRNPV
jgi:hypothetical protein